MSGDVYETAVVDSYHSSNSIVIYKKDRRRKERLGDNILLRFMNPTSAYKMVIKTTPFVVAPRDEKLSHTDGCNSQCFVGP